MGHEFDIGGHSIVRAWRPWVVIAAMSVTLVVIVRAYGSHECDLGGA